MQFFITILHVMLCFALILIILLQPGKDGASVFGGGGGNQSYGPRGQAHLLGRATTVIAAMFMVTSISLAFYGSKRIQEGSNVEDDIRRLQEEEAAQRRDSSAASRDDAVAPPPAPETTAPVEELGDEPASEDQAPAPAPQQ